MADGDEDALSGMSSLAPGLDVLDAHAGDAGNRIAEHFSSTRSPLMTILPSAAREQIVLQDFLAAELVAAMDQRDVAGDVGEVERFFDGRVAAADHGDRLVL